MEPGVEVAVIPHLYDLSPGTTGMLCLQGITGDMIVLSWLFPRAAHWTLDRGGIQGHFGQTLLTSESDDEEDDGDESVADDAAAEGDGEVSDGPQRVGRPDLPNRQIYHLHLALHNEPEPYVEEIRRIVRESQVQTVDLLGWIQGSAQTRAT